MTQIFTEGATVGAPVQEFAPDTSLSVLGCVEQLSHLQSFLSRRGEVYGHAEPESVSEGRLSVESGSG